MNRFVRKSIRAIALPLAMVSLVPGSAFATRLFRVVFAEDVFITVSRQDAVASAKAWITAVGEHVGSDIDVVVDTYQTPEDLERIVRAETADLFIMTSTQFLDVERKSLPVDPMYQPETRGQVLESYVLLTRKGRAEGLGSLRGAKMIVLKTFCPELSTLWLDHLLGKRVAGSSGSVFSDVTEVTKASAAILPVFFGKADACVVDVAGFELMREMNPQLGEQLAVRETSPPFAQSVICINRGYTGQRDAVIEGLSGLHEQPAGQQLLMVFKVDRLVPFVSESLESIRALLPDRGRLKAETR